MRSKNNESNQRVVVRQKWELEDSGNTLYSSSTSLGKEVIKSCFTETMSRFYSE